VELSRIGYLRLTREKGGRKHGTCEREAWVFIGMNTVRYVRDRLASKRLSSCRPTV
jgi:hypothetical protein